MPKVTTVQVSTSQKTPTSGDAKVKFAAEFTYSFPESLEEAQRMLPEGAVFTEFMANYVITLQNHARKILGELAEPGTKEENSLVVQKGMDAYVYGEKSTRGAKKFSDPAVELQKIWPNLTPERKAEIATQFGFSFNPVPQQDSPAPHNEDNPSQEASPALRRARR